MLSNKFIRILVVANGLIFLIVGSIALFRLFPEFIRDLSRNSLDEPAGVIVGEDLNEAKKNNLALQGIEYESPERVFNSTNFYLRVSVKSYDEAKKIDTGEMLLLEVPPTQQVPPGGYPFYGYETHDMNIVFLDENHELITYLLNKKGVVTKMNMPVNYFESKPDTTIKNITYKIVFEDSNKDGKLDYEDDQNLYISNLSGQDLTQITKGIEIESHHFQNDHKEIFVEYYEQGDDSEYRRKKFLIYNIATKTSRKLESLEKALDKIEAQLVN
ncbi:hypothetical protein R9C00_26280 [Flammeovirgaceae bacterium SG7u.111]|nr:hypothetical protein [Flammeovirgaceae bacterium SG7u.132]WPO35207.1 hypothetical protein R9C00_26280 [Flammeovirgaceae bacterium SG7u.111]